MARGTPERPILGVGALVSCQRAQTRVLDDADPNRGGGGNISSGDMWGHVPKRRH